MDERWVKQFQKGSSDVLKLVGFCLVEWSFSLFVCHPFITKELGGAVELFTSLA
jgi:hypothetical protein